MLRPWVTLFTKSKVFSASLRCRTPLLRLLSDSLEILILIPLLWLRWRSIFNHSIQKVVFFSFGSICSRSMCQNDLCHAHIMKFYEKQICLLSFLRCDDAKIGILLGFWTIFNLGPFCNPKVSETESFTIGTVTELASKIAFGQNSLLPISNNNSEKFVKSKIAPSCCAGKGLLWK